MTLLKEVLYRLFSVRPEYEISDAAKRAEKRIENSIKMRESTLQSELKDLCSKMADSIYPADLSWSEIILLEDFGRLNPYGLTAQIYLGNKHNQRYSSGINLFKPFSQKRIGFLDFQVDPDAKSILIDDIHVIDTYRQKGLGSKMIKTLVFLSQKAKLSKIKGELSPVDWHFRKKQISFYQKNGFDVTNSGTPEKSGRVLLNLDR